MRSRSPERERQQPRRREKRSSQHDRKSEGPCLGLQLSAGNPGAAAAGQLGRSSRGWWRDLTEEGIEPNPGPPDFIMWTPGQAGVPPPPPAVPGITHGEGALPPGVWLVIGPPGNRHIGIHLEGPVGSWTCLADLILVAYRGDVLLLACLSSGGPPEEWDPVVMYVTRQGERLRDSSGEEFSDADLSYEEPSEGSVTREPSDEGLSDEDPSDEDSEGEDLIGGWPRLTHLRDSEGHG